MAFTAILSTVTLASTTVWGPFPWTRSSNVVTPKIQMDITCPAVGALGVVVEASTNAGVSWRMLTMDKFHGCVNDPTRNPSTGPAHIIVTTSLPSSGLAGAIWRPRITQINGSWAATVRTDF
jgi:hypothetical protein